MSDLWPSDIVAADIKTPMRILREQAAALEVRTNGIVKAEVIHVPKADKFRYRFTVVGPLLEDYRFTLFHIEHGIDLYPVEFDLDNDIESELGVIVFVPLKAENEEEFVKILRNIFATTKTKRVINAIIGQSSEGLV